MTEDFIILAVQNYQKYLLPNIAHYEIPLEGLKFGPQLHWLDELIKERINGKPQ